MILIDKATINQLYLDAKYSNRKRAHHLLHSSYQEPVQRLFIALVKDSFVEPHYHDLPYQWEMLFVLEGCIKFHKHDKQGNIIETYLAGPSEEVFAVDIQPKEIHSLVCISDRALLLEVKEGPFDTEHAKIILEHNCS